jgi:outer membrane lipoprotein-sorting protein
LINRDDTTEPEVVFIEPRCRHNVPLATSGGRGKKAEQTMAGRGQTIIAATLMTGLMAIASAATAESVPLPPPAPLPKTGSMPPPPSAAQGRQQRPVAQAQNSETSGPSNWFSSIFGGGKQAPNKAAPSTALDPAQRAIVDKVSTYLSTVTVMSGDFTQIGPDGRQTKGQFFVQKPGKVRFDYSAPSRIDIVADGSSVVVRDRQLATQDIYPLSQTPLRFLLSDKIDLLRDTTVTAVYADDQYVTVVVEEKSIVVGTSRLMMMFGTKDYQLKQWVVTDPQGYDTTIAISNLNSRRPDPSMFKIDYTQYPN